MKPWTLVFALVAASCSTGPIGPVGLAGTTWRLVEFRSSDDRIGVVKPESSAVYTMTLSRDGNAAMQLNCNHAAGRWSAAAAGQESGAFGFGPLAMTRAFCVPPSLDGQIARDAQYVRSYLLRDGRLYLSMMADGGIYVWEPLAP